MASVAVERLSSLSSPIERRALRLRPTFAAAVAAAIVLSTTSTGLATFPGDNGKIAYLPHPNIKNTRALRTVHPDGRMDGS